MPDSLILLALPFGLALAATAAVRLASGAERGGRLAGLAVPAGFLAVWAWLFGLAWAPRGALDVAAHLALGSALIGLLLEATGAGGRRGVRWVVGVVFVVVGAWSALGLVGLARPLPADAAARGALGVAGLIALGGWALVMGRLSRVPAADAVILLVALAAGLALVGAAAGAPSVGLAAAGLAAAGLGFAVLALPLAIGAGLGTVGWLGGGGALVGLAQALAGEIPAMLPALAVLLLALFAGGTASRLPGGAGRWRPLWVLGLALLPGLLAAALAVVLRGAS